MKKTPFKWKLDRPLAVFDIEATGTNPRTDRIVELAIVKILPAGKRETHEFRVNPGIPIPAEATAIHGIRNEDVQDCPIFKALAPRVAALLENCDFAGYNLLHYDIPMLTEEFIRAGVPFTMDGRRVVDAQRIYHKREPRDLTAALAFYCNEFHLGAHGATEDVLATIRVMEGQFDRYADLPRDLESLDAYCNTRDPSWADRTGKFKWMDGDLVINFGRKQGQKVRDLVRNDPGFLQWMLKSDFPRDTAEIAANALKGVLPAPPVRNAG